MFAFIKQLKFLRKTNAGLINFFTARHYISQLKIELRSGDLKKGIDLLKKKYPVLRPRAVRFLMSLYDYLLKIEDSFVWSRRKKQPFIVHFCCWGDAYTQKAKDYLLPSLLAEGNLPAVAKEHDILLLIHCDSTTKAKLEKAEVIRRIQNYATVQIIALPESIFDLYHTMTDYPNVLFLKEVNRCTHGLKYLLLGALQAHALSESVKRGALISFLIPDSILSDSFLSYAVSKIKDKKVILTTTFRTDYHGVRHKLEPFYTDDSRTICSVPGTALSKLQVEHLHNTDRRRVISESTNHFLACARFIFKVDNGFILRALHYHPVLLDSSKVKNDLKIDYFPIDDAVLKQILVDDRPYEEQAWLCSDPSLMNFMELSGVDPEVNEPPVFVAPSTFDSLVNSVYLLLKAVPKDLDEKLNRFFIRNELIFKGDQPYHADHEIVDRQAFLSSLYKRIDGIE